MESVTLGSGFLFEFSLTLYSFHWGCFPGRGGVRRNWKETRHRMNSNDFWVRRSWAMPVFSFTLFHIVAMNYVDGQNKITCEQAPSVAVRPRPPASHLAFAHSACSACAPFPGTAYVRTPAWS